MKTLGRYFTASSGSTRFTVCRATPAVIVATAGSVRRCIVVTRTSCTGSAVIVIGPRVTAVSGLGGCCAPAGANGRSAQLTPKAAESTRNNLSSILVIGLDRRDDARDGRLCVRVA